MPTVPPIPSLQRIQLTNGQTLSYHHYGQDFKSAPVVVVNHPLTANSEVAGPHGWWNDIIGKGKVIDTDRFAVICFNVPGNGYDESFLEDYTYWNAGTVAGYFCSGLRQLGIEQVDFLIGGSIGAGIAWEMAALSPKYFCHLIPVAGDWKSSDWVLANVLVQKNILNSNASPLETARMHAMLTYRTPASFTERFNRTKNPELGIYNVESWMLYHGKKLSERFALQAYKTMNHLLGRIDITRNGKSFEENIGSIQASIHIVSIDSDLLFSPHEDVITVGKAKNAGVNIEQYIIESIYGHDAFLMESKKVRQIFEKIIIN